MKYEHNPHNSVPTIAIDEEVRQAGTCSPSYIAEALDHLHRLGIVVLENVIDARHLDDLNAVLAPEAVVLGETPGQRFNFGAQTGNINQVPPFCEPLMFSDVWANPFVLRVLAAILGPEPVLHYASANTALLATGRQPVHSDIEFPHPRFPFSFVVNIPLVDMTEENGATEVWPGSHVMTSINDQILTPDKESGLSARAILPSLVRQRQDISPPVRAYVRKGSIIIRDLRLWHAGLPSLSPTPRVMLAFVWQPSWWCGRGVIRLPMKVREIVEDWQQDKVKFRIEVEWVDGEVIPHRNGTQETSLATSDAALLKLFS